MRPGARLQAAIEILADMDVRKRPAAEAVKDWMLAHRFAGSKDRAEIGDLVFAALRWKSSSAWRLDSDLPRSWALGALRWGFGAAAETFDHLFTNDPHAPPALTSAEARALREASLVGAPAWVAGDYPDWLDPDMARAFGDARALEGAALAAPAPLDLRANRLKIGRAQLLQALEGAPRLESGPLATPHAVDGVRIPWRRGGSFAFAAEPAFQKGWFEVQDEGSQLAAELSEARAGLQVGDVCAGGGGKTLALAAMMGNAGQIYAHDVDHLRLAPLHERAARAGVRNLQIRTPRRGQDVVADLEGRLDLVLVDAPCSGSGTWRRQPDAKWRLRPKALSLRQQEQQSALALGWRLVRPGGRLVYVTCSVLPAENEDAAAAFLQRTRDAVAKPLSPAPAHVTRGAGIQFTPRLTQTDGFFVAVFERQC
jgi:16S rRNA (cytosine967-C5)-methyltransferase